MTGLEIDGNPRPSTYNPVVTKTPDADNFAMEVFGRDRSIDRKGTPPHEVDSERSGGDSKDEPTHSCGRGWNRFSVEFTIIQDDGMRGIAIEYGVHGFNGFIVLKSVE